MINHILVPLDGSALAECVLPHVLAVALTFEARITVLHILQPQDSREYGRAIDPLDWHLKKREAEIYLDSIAARLRGAGLDVKEVILDGSPAECIVEHARHSDVDLIVLSTHGRSGLSAWNISGVVQKIILRALKSTLLVRAYKFSREPGPIQYNRLFVGLDCSVRAETVLSVAVRLARFYRAQLILGTVICKPELLHRFPMSTEETEFTDHIADRNYRVALDYFQRLHSQISLQGIDLETRLVTSDNVMAALHDMVDQENADLVLLTAHGHSGERRWPYGSMATSFIAFGTTTLLIIQDLSVDEVECLPAELACRETKGH